MFRLGGHLFHQQWFIDAKTHLETVFNIFKTEHKTWRIYLFEMFSRYGSVSTLFGQNIPCVLFSMALAPLKDKFEIPELYQTHWKIAKETILSYPEYNIKLEISEKPAHIKKSNTENKLRFFYSLGGKRTRKNKLLKKMPDGYGGVISYLAATERNKHKLHKTRRISKRKNR